MAEITGDELEVEIKTLLGIDAGTGNPIEASHHNIVGDTTHYYVMSNTAPFLGIAMWVITTTANTASEQAQQVLSQLRIEINDIETTTSIVGIAIIGT